MFLTCPYIDQAISRIDLPRHRAPHLFLPEREELDKLLRYEAMINRQLNHAIAELDRLQLRRKAGPAGV